MEVIVNIKVIMHVICIVVLMEVPVIVMDMEDFNVLVPLVTQVHSVRPI